MYIPYRRGAIYAASFLVGAREWLLEGDLEAAPATAGRVGAGARFLFC